MMEIKFKTLNDLYNRLKPALDSKVKEFKLSGFKYVEIEDLWQYLQSAKWVNSTNLDLAQMVEDIFALTIEEIINYRKEAHNE